MPIVTVRNSGKVYSIDVSDSDSITQFKHRIQEATLIPVLRQKLLCKLPPLDDSAPCAPILAKVKQPIALLGSPAPIDPAPIPKPLFSEDLTPDQVAVSALVPLGLANLGNTCYLNATLQALFAVENVRLAVLNTTESSPADSAPQSDTLICKSLKAVFSQMNLRVPAVSPAFFLTVFHNVFPQFAERSPQGGLKQQDAEEALTQIVALLSRHYNLNDLFRIDFHSQQKCITNESEPEQEATDHSTKLNCHISIKTNFLRDGILAGLSEEIEKYLDSLGANATYKVSRTLMRLPKYLTVQFVRFYWKRDTNKNSKILRRVQFPFELDVADMLHLSIKAEKTGARDAIRAVEKESMERIRDYKKSQKLQPSMSPVEQQQMHEAALESMRDKFRADVARALPHITDLPAATENPLLVYHLCLVITHAGALADSGHYQAYVRDNDDIEGNKWWCFNDDKVVAASREKIEQLAGGGESDSALILVYKAAGL